jgi:hypothetical protein
MKSFKLYFLLAFTAFLACKPAPSFTTLHEDIWKNRSGYGKDNKDTLCHLVRFKKRWDYMYIGKDTLPSFGAFTLRRGDFGVQGHFTNCVPDKHWRYINLKTFMTCSEDFECGRSIGCGNPEGGIERIEFGQVFGFDYYKRDKKTIDKKSPNGMTSDVVRFRNKLHKEIYRTQEKWQKKPMIRY